ncbi:hypothetical protein PV702_07330 [Streptomyces sp. FL06-04B]|uniref:hypothetical protein n=1 Tax=unclassified Streptomyces TaxID=2593676 RepID=UPI0029B20EED|nr:MULTISPECIES: hypothetical protein [unclassified Streptomyces]MDX3606283.1 hypothetical protein [Streptomyces sp. FL06-04B]MDX3737547.1 hypothetical protein [Streptomyces sp. ID01-15D]
MTKNAKIGAALVGGYLLGRTKKAKLALGFGMFLLGKKIDLDPRQIGRMLADSPALGSLNDQVRKELVEATRTAATKAVTQRAGSLADSLQQRTQALGAAPVADEEEPDEDEEHRAADEDEAEAAGDEEDTGGSENRKRAPRKTAASGAKSASRSRSSSGSGRSGSGGKTSAPARKRAGGARKAAASGARKARGGDDA